jgi:hypothetical protein
MPASRRELSPVAWPKSTAAVANIIDSEDDSSLLPCAKPAWPDAQFCPAYASNVRRNGKRLSERS